MAIITLITTDTNRYRDALTADGHEVHCLEPGDAVRLVADNAIAQQGGTTVIEAAVWDGSLAPVLGALAGRARVICLARTVDEPLRRDLLAHGVADVIASDHPRNLASYLKAIDQPEENDRGLIAVLDDGEPTRRLAETIIHRFHYSPVFVESVDGLCDALARHNIVLTLLNLGVGSLDLQGLVRRSYDNRDLRRVPLLAYKDMERGLFVHELISGLNRLTRFILSPEELCSFLVDLLFRKEMVSNLARFNRHIDFDATSFFANDSLDRIVFMKGPELFEYHNIMMGDNYRDMLDCSAVIQRTLLRADGLRWMRLDYERQSISIAGTAAREGA